MGHLGGWFPLYAADWLTDTDVRSLEPSDRGTLADMWCYSWINGPLAPDSELLARVLSAPVDSIERLLSVFFAQNGAGWISPRLEAERKKLLRISRARAKAGKLGGLAKADKRLANTKQPPSPSPSPSPSPTAVQMDSPNGESVGSPDPTAREARELIGYWRDRYHTQAHVTKERVAKARARLRTFGAEDLRTVIDQVCKDPWWLGDNDRHTDFSFPESFLKNDAQVDKFLTKAREASQSPGSKPRGTATCVKCGRIYARAELRVQEPPICQGCS